MFANPNRRWSPRTCIGLALLGAAVAGCDQGAPPDQSGPAAPPQPSAIANGAAPAGEDEAALVERARAALAGAILHADTARLSNVRAGSVGAICGEVARSLGGGRYAAPLPFLVTRGGAAMVSSTPAVNLRDPEDLFPDVYLQMCASPAELSAMAAEMGGAAPAPPPLEPLAAPEPIEAPVPGVAPPPELPPRPAPGATPLPPPARPVAPAPAGPISNFSDAVMRPDQRR